MKTVITMSFIVRQNHIIKTLCENKQRPQLHCNGKCYLKKKLDAENNRARQLPGFLTEKIELSTIVPVHDIKFVTSENVIRHAHNYILKPYTTTLTAVFRPPSV